MIGLTPYDDNQQINNYKAQFGLTNPCAGVDGEGPEAIATVIDGQNFFGYPTYCVVCPDKKLYFNVCFPPTTECFESYILACGATDINENVGSSAAISVFPNPVKDILNIQFSGNKPQKIELFNQVGLQVRDVEMLNIDNHKTIALDDLPAGIYFLRIETTSESFIEKVIIW